MRRFFLGLFLLCGIQLFAADLTIKDILANFDKVLGIPTIQGSFKVQLISRNGDVREIQARAYQKLIGTSQDNRLFIFDFPPTVRGTSLLLHSFYDGRPNNMWIYLPAVKRVRRIALESSGGGYFMGSDFTYRDLIYNDNNKMKIERLPDAIREGVDSYALKVTGETPQIQQEHGYSHIISYYAKDNFFLHYREYYDFNGELLKIYTVHEYLEFGQYIYPTNVSMTNVQSNHKSFLLVENVSTDDIPDDYFTTRYMQNN
ncbi:MAG: outer membrane lipoprotein-sorting protein [Spirochaetia bacterium]|jgi:hypothetical protein|nr:outer membrane lipoprotein-sorting protein [Spirochaetia bacterium]